MQARGGVLAVRGQLKGSIVRVDGTGRVVEEGSRTASHNRLTGHSKGFWDDRETVRDRDVTNQGLPDQRYKPSRTEALLRPSVQTPYRRLLTKRGAFRRWKMLSEVQSKCGASGRTELHERVSTTNGNKNPKEGRRSCPRRGQKMA